MVSSSSPRQPTSLRNRLAAVLGRVPGDRAWAVAAAALAACLVGYYGFLGARYWRAQADTSAFDVRVGEIAAALSVPTPDEAALAREFEGGQKAIRDLEAALVPPEAERLIEILDRTARSSGVELVSVVTGNPAPSLLDGVSYDTEPVAVTTNGDADSVGRFLSQVQRQVPMVVVSELRLASLDSAPSSRVELVFYRLAAGEAGR